MNFTIKNLGFLVIIEDYNFNNKNKNCNNSRIACLSYTTYSHVKHVIDIFSDLGYLKISNSKSSRRQKEIVLTKKGETISSLVRKLQKELKN